MNIFTKIRIKNILDQKVILKEIKSYQILDSKIFIKKSKRCQYTIDLTGLSDSSLVRLLQKKIPDPGIINTANFFIREIRNLKLNTLVN
jgi:hypothetical protein